MQHSFRRLARLVTGITLGASMLYACGADTKAPTEANFTAALDRGLVASGEDALCLEPAVGYYVNFQPVREPPAIWEGLATAGFAQKQRLGSATFYRLTERGVQTAERVRGVPSDLARFCFGHIRVGKVSSFTDPADMLGVQLSQARWTAEISNLSDWAKNERTREALPQIDVALKNAEREKHSTALILDANGWRVDQKSLQGHL